MRRSNPVLDLRIGNWIASSQKTLLAMTEVGITQQCLFKERGFLAKPQKFAGDPSERKALRMTALSFAGDPSEQKALRMTAPS